LRNFFDNPEFALDRQILFLFLLIITVCSSIFAHFSNKRIKDFFVEKMKVEIILKHKRCRKMNRNKKITGIMVLSLLLLTAFVFFDDEKHESTYKDKMIRLHVIANSNSQEDQELKLKVRDAVISSLNERLNAYENIEESRDFIRVHMGEIINTANEAVKKSGSGYPVCAELKQTWIPEKNYGNLTLPAGKYEALNVVIGEGKGENWWCVLFPPLCLIDIQGNDLASIEEALSHTLTEEEYQMLADETKGKTPILRLRFKTLETAEQLKADIEKLLNKINKEKASID